MKHTVGRFALRHRASITFLVLAAALAGAYASLHMPSAVFPQTNFPRIIIMIHNGVMPADEMMATITRPVEEAAKEIQGCQTIRSSTGRGTAEVDLFFDWHTDMRQAELATQSRLAQLRGQIPDTTQTEVYRMTFSTFPIIGLSLTTPDPIRSYELARNLQPQFLRIPGVSRVELLGGRAPEYQVTADPLRLAALGLTLTTLADDIEKSNIVAPAGMHQQDHSLYLTIVDGRVHTIADIENLTIPTSAGPVPISSFAAVARAPEPALTVVTADGQDAVLLNIYSQPDASTLDIAGQLKSLVPDIRKHLPPDARLTFFYDQSLLVHSSISGVWNAIVFGLILSILILYLFLKSWRMTFVATLVIPITVLVTIIALWVCNQSFNLMTLGGIAAAIGLIIDDAIVVVEAIHAKTVSGVSRNEIIQSAMSEIFSPLIGSTLTPVVVFIPLAFLTGIAGIFFRSLAITMVVALLTSLVLALTLTPALAVWAVRNNTAPHNPDGGFILRHLIGLYESIVRTAIAHRWTTLGLSLFVLLAAATGYTRLKTDFLPPMDESGFIIDYISPPGTSLEETDRQMRQAEAILQSIPEVESYSRRTGTALGVHLDEPNTGDFLVKLRPDRHRTSDQVIADLRARLSAALPRIEWEYPGILTDLIGDLTWADEPIEVKIFSTDPAYLTAAARKTADDLDDIKGVVDTSDGLVYTGPSISLRVRPADAAQLHITTTQIADALSTAMQGRPASTILEGDQLLILRVKANSTYTNRIDQLSALPIQIQNNKVIRLDQVADITITERQLELHRDDLRQDIAVTADLENLDLGTAMQEVQSRLGREHLLDSGKIEYGGLYQQQQESFANLTLVLIIALVLVFLVALLEFRSFLEPIAIVFGAALSLFGIIAALLITDSTLNIVTFLGAIIGMGIVHKNGLLMLDYVTHLRAQGVPLHEALIQSGRRRLRPVLMTSLAAGIGMLPLARGVDMLRPLAIAVIGAVAISILLSLVATPALYYLLSPLRRTQG